MTEKLYVNDAYLREFDAQVISCNENKGRFEVILDQSCFYPEGGGQPGDRGVLIPENDADQVCIDVFDTHEAAGEIVHYCKVPVMPGTKVHGKIDWEYRFDLMQNHSGEHIVSGLLNARFGCNNVGFHMGSDIITIDLDCDISWQSLLETELQANQIIWKNEETMIRIYDHESVKSVSYRSKKEIPGDIRIVTFPGADTCACCGTHVKRTGEIGLIRILSVAKFHDGVRVEMLCGKRAFLYSQKISGQNKEISVLLSAKPVETAAAVSKLKDNYAQASFLASAMEEKLFSMTGSQYTNRGNVLLFSNGYGPESVRKLCAAVMGVCHGTCVVFSSASNEGDGVAVDWKYAVGEENGNVKELVTRINTEMNGRGGGKPFFAQGSCKTTRADIREMFEAESAWTIASMDE